MRTRTVGINIRVTESEKRKMENAAKKCGLSLSAYLRKLGLGKEVKAISTPGLYTSYRQLTYLRDSWKTLPERMVDRYFDEVVQSFLQAYHEIEGEEK